MLLYEVIESHTNCIPFTPCPRQSETLPSNLTKSNNVNKNYLLNALTLYSLKPNKSYKIKYLNDFLLV